MSNLNLQLNLGLVGLAEAAARPAPIIKWPGGKGGVVSQLMRYAPAELHQGGIRRYVEPFLGGGALFFHLAGLGLVESFVLSDVNPDLMGMYRTVQQDVEVLIEHLGQMQAHYLPLTEAERRQMFYRVRDTYNARPASPVEHAACLLFLNRTCFNGLYRVNGYGQFNVAFGDYKSPAICNPPLLRAAHLALQRAELLRGDFMTVRPWLRGDSTWGYLDPPYRPLSKSANFTSYTAGNFGPRDHERLADFAKSCIRARAKVMASNSDPGDGVVEKLYGRRFTKHTVTAQRNISVTVAGRGPVKEMLLTSYA
ncbi:MAG: Dam family site-specific DNA-(adenine-N6)-methyltransferase [Anaerolineae bacterium]|nr:Dam family site-specific DNA-(adenine-N6)-methyltransferase [Anaerolineae bacterium]